MVAHRFRRRAALLAVLGSLLLSLVGVAPVQAIGLSFTVDSTGDAPDKNTGVVLCKTLVNTCTLRAAIQQANAIDPGPGNHHTIILPAGTITMFVKDAGEDNAAQGDYDIKRSVTIRGAGAGNTIIQGSATSTADAFDRIFDVQTLGIDVVLEDLTVRRGNATNAAGGGLRVNSAGATITLHNVVFSANRSFDHVGAAIAARGGELSIIDSRISSNDAPDGPVIDVDGGTVSVSRSTFSSNSSWSGVISVHDEGSGFIDRSTFSGNEVLGPNPIALRIGKDSLDESEATVRNSTFSGNTGPADSRVINGNRNVALLIESSTIAGNTAIGVSGSHGTKLKNTLLSANSGGNCHEALASLGHNLDTGHTCPGDGPGDIEGGTADLGALADNGGPTRTRALGSESDAIDAGADCPAIDQRSRTRPKDGDSDGTARCDIGAFEAAEGTAPAPTPTPTPTATPTVAPTIVPTASSPAATEAATPAATGGASGAASAVPSPGTSAAGSPAPTGAPVPAGGLVTDATLPWILLALLAGLLLLLFIVLARRRRPRSDRAV